jgi:AcrR family transcriptional regulator
VSATAVIEDGRRVRRDRNRDAVVDAMLELYREGSIVPSADEIAERAGLSARSLFRYFDDIDDLVRAAVSRHLERLQPLLPIDLAANASTAERIAAIVNQRVRLFEAIGSVGTVARLRAESQPLIATELREFRRFLRDQLKRALAAELAASGTNAATVLTTADVLCSFESYQLLRHDHSLSRPKIAATLTTSLTRLLTLEAS